MSDRSETEPSNNVLPPESPPPASGSSVLNRARNNKWITGTIWIAEQLGKLAIIWTVISYIAEAPDRRKAKDYQAWQLVNAAKTGDGGRKDALHDLIHDSVSLSGLQFFYANLVSADLEKGRLDETLFDHTNLTGANLQRTSLRDARFVGSSLLNVSLQGSHIENASFDGPALQNVNASCYHVKPNLARRSTCRGSEILQTRFGTSIEKSDFSHAYVFNAAFDGGHAPQNFTGSDAKMVISNVSFHDAELDGSLFENVSLTGNDFTATSLSRVVFINVSINDKNNFKGANLQDAGFKKVLYKVGYSAHDIQPSDIPDARLCNTMFETVTVNRDCKKPIEAQSD
jgi:uncharacterized protein YjbI with pentapeptide repeats